MDRRPRLPSRLMTHKRHWLCTAAMVLMPGLSPYQSTRLSRYNATPELGCSNAATRVHHASRRRGGVAARGARAAGRAGAADRRADSSRNPLSTRSMWRATGADGAGFARRYWLSPNSANACASSTELPAESGEKRRRAVPVKVRPFCASKQQKNAHFHRLKTNLRKPGRLPHDLRDHLGGVGGTRGRIHKTSCSVVISARRE
jgi:hypothetical protein